MHIGILTIVLISVSAVITQASAQNAPSYWPSWRGPEFTGVSSTANPPLTWDETNHVKWKFPIPGFGTSTPIVWGDKIFVLTAVSTGKKADAAPGATNQASSQEIYSFNVLCVSRDSGKLLWQRTAREEAPHEGHHKDHGFASASPVTDGEVLVAYFGSRGLHCMDLNGSPKWTKDLGKMHTRNSFGEGSSPALYGNMVVVNWDDETENDFIAAFNKTSGKELWRTKRNEPTGWSTPLIVEYGGKTQVVVNAETRVRAYDLSDGKEIWECGGQTANPIPTPVANKDTVFITSGFRGNAVMAIALGRTGDLTGTDAIRWSRAKNTPYVPSPLLAGDFLYLVTGNNPVLTCLDAKSGTPHFEGERFEGLSGIYASPVSAGDKVYVLGRNGSCVVLKKGPRPEVLARNSLAEKTDASMALAGRQIFIRTHKSLYCIAE